MRHRERHDDQLGVADVAQHAVVADAVSPHSGTITDQALAAGAGIVELASSSR